MAELRRKAQETREQNKALGIKPVYLDPIAKAHANPKSLRLAINGKCWDCIGAGHDPNPKAAIRDCQITDCTLHPVRPYQNLGQSQGSEETDEEEG